MRCCRLERSCVWGAWLLVAVGMVLVNGGGALRTVMEPTRLLIGKNVTLWEADHAFLHTTSGVAHFEVSSATCTLSRNFSVDVLSQVGSEGYVTDVLGFQWYLFYYRVYGQNLHLIIEGEITCSLSFRWPSLQACAPSQGLTFVFGKDSEVAVSFNSDFMHSSPYPTLPSMTYPGGENRYFRTTSRHDANGTFHAFIPIGMMVLFVGVCVRCCHYCRYKAQMRKRSRDALDAAAAEETVEATPALATSLAQDAPPQYDEICASEPPPPSYADLFQVVVVSGDDKGKESTTENQVLLQEELTTMPLLTQSISEATETQRNSSETDDESQQETSSLVPTAPCTSEPLATAESTNATFTDSSGDLGVSGAPRVADSSLNRPSTSLRAWASRSQARLKTHFAFRRLVEEREEQRQASPSSLPK